MSEFAPKYLSSIRAHVLDAGEESLSHAYDLGRKALSEGLGLLDVLTLYDEMLRAWVLQATPERRDVAAAAVSDYFREFISPFEMSFRGYQESNRELSRLNEELGAARRAGGGRGARDQQPPRLRAQPCEHGPHLHRQDRRRVAARARRTQRRALGARKEPPFRRRRRARAHPRAGRQAARVFAARRG